MPQQKLTVIKAKDKWDLPEQKGHRGRGIYSAAAHTRADKCEKQLFTHIGVTALPKALAPAEFVMTGSCLLRFCLQVVFIPWKKKKNLKFQA